MVAGSRGREHAPGWKLANSPNVGLVFVVPGNGRKVFAVTVMCSGIKEARNKSYEFVDKIHFSGQTYRTDISI